MVRNKIIKEEKEPKTYSNVFTYGLSREELLAKIPLKSKVTKEKDKDSKYLNPVDLRPDKKKLSDFNMVPDDLPRGELLGRLRVEIAMRNHWIKSKRWHSKTGSESLGIPTWREGLAIRNGKIDELRRKVGGR